MMLGVGALLPASFRGRKTLSPSALYLAGEQGFWLDPSDLSTQFQDSAGTTPVTAAGQPVGKILDKSGRGNHFVQSVTTSRPVLQQDANGLWYWLLDGIDDGLASAATVNFTGTDKVAVIAGVLKASDAAAGDILEIGTSVSSVQACFALFGPGSATPNFSFGSRGTAAVVFAPRTGFAAPVSAVLLGQGDISGPSSSLSVNGGGGTPVVTTQGTGNYGNLTAYFGRRAGTTLPFNGRVYGLCVVGAPKSSTQLLATARWMGIKTGVGF